LNKQLFVVAPEVNKVLIQSWGFYHIAGLNWGDSTVLVKNDETLRIMAVEAMHAKDEPLKSQLGKGKGHNVYRIYCTGDIVWVDGIQDNTKYGRINLLVPDMGSVGSDGKIGRRGLNAQDCLEIVKAPNPDRITPVHHTTFSMYVELIAGGKSSKYFP
jgi:N-acyl-phosphatidylethanolamine-hydrolysing phospholipase D